MIGWNIATLLVLRFEVLILLAGLVTLTTKSSDMINSLATALFWLRPIGVNPANVGLTFALAIRFIPILTNVTHEVREAQKTRGLEHSIIAVAIPVIVRTLKIAYEISDAIEARGYHP